MAGAAAELTGSADIAKICTTPEQYEKCDSLGYLMPHDGKPYFILRTKQDEYCFTGRLLLHVDGKSATSSKRLIKRYPYYRYPISNVQIETAGNVDRDVELKFTLAKEQWSIDVAKALLPELVPWYKCLVLMEEEQLENAKMMDWATFFMSGAKQIKVQIAPGAGQEAATTAEMQAKMADGGFEWITAKYRQFCPQDFSHVFERIRAV
eukprot:CAMPEP_0114540298 /NCGR_PEP_ID=MMETSP0114-20121206/687_1 /TAXON_ID=31324 /ORGANISM="Goniomonas sp, Strain m" /LENGTH=207 /DNA_ID=CAMNT_0001724439 /DNA_START=14 /DNA_END=637 /DNA_ORIENTATION=+